MKRRDFIKNTCSFCLGFSALGLLEFQLTGCKAPYQLIQSNLVDGKVIIPIESFLNDSMVVVRVKKLEHDLLVIKNSEEKFNTIYLQCSHQNNPLVVTKSELFCSAHGSSFDLEGNVKKAPAINSLTKFKTTRITDKIYVDLLNKI